MEGAAEGEPNRGKNENRDDGGGAIRMSANESFPMSPNDTTSVPAISTALPTGAGGIRTNSVASVSPSSVPNGEPIERSAVTRFSTPTRIHSGRVSCVADEVFTSTKEPPMPDGEMNARRIPSIIDGDSLAKHWEGRGGGAGN
jgi:hypothetical protein